MTGVGLREIFRPRANTFFTLLQSQADVTLRGLQALEDYMRTRDRAMADAVITLEREEDELRRVLIDELNRNFITPIDREDIFALSRAIDDVLDYACSTVEEMTMLGVEPTPQAHRMVVVLRDAAEHLACAVRHLKERPRIANDHAVRAKQLENLAETTYREALRDLFAACDTGAGASTEGVIHVLKMREIYRHLSNAADRGDEAANIIGDIVVKMT